MTPKEKAKELVDKFQKQLFFQITDERLDINEAKGCALIAVDEILNQYCGGKFNYKILGEEETEFWNEVKTEIENL